MQARMFKLALSGVAAVFVLPLAGVAGAQDACKINDGSPYQLAGARNYVTMAANAKFPAEIPKHLNNAFKVLTDEPEKIKNEPGRQFLLLRTYAQYLQRDDASFVVRRGDIGFTRNPDGKHNILLAIDTAVTTVTAAMPECKERVEPYRQRFMGEIFNKAAHAVQDEQFDSAAFYANLATQAAPRDPRPWNVMWAVYNGREQADSARYAMLKVIELAGDDSTYQSVAQQHRYNLAVMTLNDADTQEGAAREASVKRARDLLDAYLKVEPGHTMATQALGRALRLSGDTAAVAALYKAMIDNPEKYTDIQLFEGGSNAAAAERAEDAARLFEAGLAKNPYHRLGLLNLANVYFNQRDGERLAPIARRLLEVDPNGSDARQVYAGYWQVVQRAETDAAKKRLLADSALASYQAAQEFNPRVDVRATKSANNFVLQGSVANTSDKEQSWTLQFELLDDKGQPVGTKEVPVGPVAANGSATFSVSVEAPRAVAFRYAPLK